MPFPDSQLDARLRSVPLPDGLLERLRAIPQREGKGGKSAPQALTPDPTPRGRGDNSGRAIAASLGGRGEKELDRALCDVALPPGLLERLYAIPLAEDDGLDEALRSVPLPHDLIASCRRHARRHSARRDGRQTGDRALQMSRMAIAASLILAITLSLGSAMLLSLALNSQNNGQLATKEPQKPEPIAPAPKTLELSWDALAGDASASSPSRARMGKREIEPVPVEPGPSGDLVASALPRGDNLLALSAKAEGYEPNSWDDYSESLVRPTTPRPQGLDWPLVPAADHRFLVTTGFHPFVSPAADRRLQSCAVPLSVEPSSYELARRYLDRGEWPPVDRDHGGIRTEEFLAAVDYHYPRPEHEGLGLTVAGGPSPISGEGYCLLQVGVQARHIESGWHQPLHLVLLVDTSTSMRWGSRMEIIRHALGDLSDMIGADDHISLVTFNQAAHVLVEYLGRYDLPTFAAAADSLSAQGATNILGGLREAYGVARQTHGPAQPAVRVVLLTDGLLDLEASLADKIRQQVARAAGENIPMDVIDLGQLKQTDPQVTALAEAGHGRVHRAASAQEVRWSLRETITGRSQVVAKSARLQVTFNPKSVVAYRLLGHESRDWAGLLPGPVVADFRDGQSATALFEVQLAPNGPSDVADVDLTWYEPEGRTLAGKTEQAARSKVQRSQFAATLAGSADSLQEAAVVAYTAEVLRRSPFVFRGHHEWSTSTALFHAAELANQVERGLRQRPSFAEFVSFIRREMKAHPAPRALP